MHTNNPRVDGFGEAGPARTLPRVIAVLGVGALVAVAAPGIRMIVPALELSGTGSTLVRLAGAGALAAGIAALLAGRRGALAVAGGRPIPIVESLRAAAIIMAVVAVVALLAWPRLSGIAERAGPARPVAEQGWGAGAEGGGAPPPPSIGGEQSIRGSEGLDPITLQGESVIVEEENAAMRALRRMARIVPFLMVAFIVAVFAVSLARRAAARWRRNGAAAEVAEAEGAEAAVAEARASAPAADPRGRIIAAYLRMSAALDEADAGRAAHEAPHEHLRRALGSLGSRAAPLHRLAELYVQACFTLRPLGEAHAAAATEHLEAGLAEFRALRRGRPAPSGEAGTGGAPA